MINGLASIDKLQLLEALDISAFWEAELGERIVHRSGKNWTARSPFREDKNPSFSVNIDSGLFNDFAGEGGDIFDFVMRSRNCGFTEALDYVKSAHLPGLPAQSFKPAPRPQFQRKPFQSYPPASFRYIEVVRGGYKARRSGKMVERENPFLLDCFGRPAEGEIHASVFVYPIDAVAYRESPLKGTDGERGQGKGSIAGYDGPVKAMGLHIDLDGEGDPNLVLGEARDLVSKLREVYAVAPSNIRVFFSGNRGFHFYILDEKFKDQSGSEGVPLAIAKACRQLAGQYGCFDGQVYNRTSLLRVTNTRHPKTGLYKVPLSHQTLQSWTWEQIQNYAKCQRSLRDSIEVVSQPMDLYAETLKDYLPLLDKRFNRDPASGVIRFEDGTSYTPAEMNKLEGLSPEDARAVHLVKNLFQGRFL
jgi:hypothetical protein